MNYTASIIYFSAKADALKISGKLAASGIESKLFQIKKCLITENIPDYSVFDKSQADPLEKAYLRDGKTSQASLVSAQKIILDKILADADGSTIFFIEESFVPECFYIRKVLFRSGKPFFSFGRIAPKFGLTVVRGALDLGFHEASFLDVCGPVSDYQLSSNTLNLPEFNGIIAIDTPPDPVPARYLRFFRSPLMLTRSLIRFYNLYLPGQKHPEILVYSPEKAADCYTSSERAAQLVRLLGKRGKTFSDFSELPSGTTVLTWSTKRFFSLLKNGFRPVPATKSLEAKMFDPKIRSIGALLTAPITMLSFLKIEDFLKNSELRNFKIK